VVAAAIPEGPAVADARENSENGDDEDEVIEAAGTLELGREVVRSCAEISAMSARNAEDDGALEAIRSLGKCMNRGALRGSRLQIAGGGRATRLFREAMGRAGVSKDRVEVVLCHADDMDRRVQVNLPAKGAFAPAQGQRVLSAADVALTLSVKKSQIVGFIMGGSLDD
jgi:hypothetical protein